jgi:FkbM family methyltransferase
MGSIEIIQFRTKYGNVFSLKNDVAFVDSLKDGKLFEEDILLQLGDYIRGQGSILDIGAHIGCHTLYYDRVRDPSQKIFCFEPQRIIHHILEMNIKTNNIQNIEVFNCAAGPYDDVLYLDSDFTKDHYPPWLKVDYTSSNGMNFGGLGLTYKEGGEPIKMVHLDSFLKDKIEKVHFIKIDTEGAENGIVYGLGELIYRDKPTLFIENNIEKNRNNEFEKKLPLIKEFNYFDMLKHIGYDNPISFPGGNNLFVFQKNNYALG